MDQLVDALRPGQVLEAVLTEVAQRRPVGQAVQDEGGRRADRRICPPWPAAMIRAVRLTAGPW